MNNNVTYTHNHESSSVQPRRRRSSISARSLCSWWVDGLRCQGECKVRKALVWVQNLRRLNPSEIKIITIFMQYLKKIKMNA